MKEAIHQIISSGTGEVITEYGTFISQKEKERNVQYAKKHEESEYIKNEFGKFIWFLFHANKILDYGISSSDLTKIIFLATFIDYNNVILKNGKSPATKYDIKNLLALDYKYFNTFYNNMIDKTILIESDEKIMMNKDIFAKGKIFDTKLDSSKTRLYINSVRYMYRNASIKEHKTLSYVFQAIPFVHSKYNILCKNIYCKTKEEIDSISIEDFAELIGYSKGNARRLRSILIHTSVGNEPAITVAINSTGTFMVMNPRLCFSGTDLELVEGYSFFTRNIKKQ